MIPPEASITILTCLLRIISFVRSNTEIIQITTPISLLSNQECSNELLSVPGLIRTTSKLIDQSITRSLCLYTNPTTTSEPQTNKLSPTSVLQQLTSNKNHLSSLKTYSARISWSASDHVEINLSFNQLNNLSIFIQSNHDSSTKSIDLDLLIEPLYLGFLPETTIPLILSLFSFIFVFVYFQIPTKIENFSRMMTKDA